MLATFVLAFLCLNVGGFVCLTYCSQVAMAMPSLDDSHLSEHCRRAKKEAEEKDRDATKLSASAASCCMMPVSMFGVPIEKQTRPGSVVAVDAVPIVNAEPVRFEILAFARSHISSTPVYRPPPLDRRGERILHSVIRI
ncbi:MAG: hypothetical protein QM785_07605 [Pyrinomonadaceae bacterium]